MTIAITGSTGFLGSCLKKTFQSQGIEVIGLNRSPEKHDRIFSNKLSEDQVFETISSIKPKYLVHAAWDMSGYSNLEIVKHLTSTCNTLGIHLIFISSMAAHPGAQSTYGKQKLVAESIIATKCKKHTIVRPGTIVGNGGLFLRTIQTAKKAPFLPLFFGGAQRLQLIHVDDLVKGIAKITANELQGEFNLGDPNGITLKNFYQILSEIFGKKPVILAPGNLALLFLYFCEKLGLKLPITSDNLLGLKHHHTFETRSDLQKLEIKGLSTIEFRTYLNQLIPNTIP